MSGDLTHEERDLLASEYVLGLLDAADTARCERLLAGDATFNALVEDWRQRLADLDATAQPETPDPALWARIEASMEGASATRAALRPVVSAAPGSWVASLWESLALWRGIGLVASTAALALALAVGFFARESARTPVLVAVLLSDQNRPAAIVNAFRDGHAELLALDSIRAPEGKSLQVWTLWDRARGPVSVGLLDAMRNIDLALSGLPQTTTDQLFEVTLEPAGGSPTGRPTGPILMKGNTARTDAGT